MRPGKPTVDHPFIHRVKDFKGIDHGAVRQHVHLDAAARHFVYPVGKAFHQFKVNAGRWYRRLDFQSCHGLRLGSKTGHSQRSSTAGERLASIQSCHAFSLVSFHTQRSGITAPITCTLL